MDSHQLFTMALNLGPEWKVVKSGFTGELRQLEWTVNFVPGTKFADPESGVLCPVYDTVEKNWRHLNFWPYQTILTARVPRVSCPDGKVRTVLVPWAEVAAPGTSGGRTMGEPPRRQRLYALV